MQSSHFIDTLIVEFLTTTLAIETELGRKPAMTRKDWATGLFGKSAIAAAGIAAMVAIVPLAMADEADDAAKFVRELSENAIAVIAAADVTEAHRSDELRQLFRTNFEVDLISRFVLGRHWHNATEAERLEYMDLYADFIVTTYAARWRVIRAKP